MKYQFSTWRFCRDALVPYKYTTAKSYHVLFKTTLHYASKTCIYPAVLVKRQHRFFWSIFFAVEKTLSEGAVEAGIAIDTSLPVWQLEGSRIHAFSANPSGHPLYSEVNFSLLKISHLQCDHHEYNGLLHQDIHLYVQTEYQIPHLVE